MNSYIPYNVILSMPAQTMSKIGIIDELIFIYKVPMVILMINILNIYCAPDETIIFLHASTLDL